VEHFSVEAVGTSADLPRKGRLAMPILGYCLYVGGTLLALLFVADFYIPKQAPREETPHTYNIPIAAALIPTQAITFSGQTRDFGAPPPMTVVDFAAKAQAGASPAPTARTFAQMTPAAQRAAKPAPKKVARRKINPSPENSFAHIPEEWRSRYTYTGMAFARPFSW
jgi:hypothetical protein